jgi:hypothetical protein
LWKETSSVILNSCLNGHSSIASSFSLLSVLYLIQQNNCPKNIRKGTLGGETDSSSPSCLIFSIKILKSINILSSEPYQKFKRQENETNVIVNLSTVNFLCLTWNRIAQHHVVSRRTNQVEVLPSPGPHMSLPRQEAHFWQD